jgi:hypothetical protein
VPFDADEEDMIIDPTTGDPFPAADCDENMPPMESCLPTARELVRRELEKLDEAVDQLDAVLSKMARNGNGNGHHEARNGQ